MDDKKRKGGRNQVKKCDIHDLQVLYTNVDNSLLSKYDELCTLLANKHYDIISLVEIKPKQGQTPDTAVMQIKGYDLFIGDLMAQDTRCAQLTCLHFSPLLAIE